MTTTLCCCHHLRTKHGGGMYGGDACDVCKCAAFEPVSKFSSHLYRRGSPATPTKVGRLKSGDLVTINEWPDGLRATNKKTGALVGIVQALNAVRGSEPRQWVISTDLGDLLPLTGTTTVTVVKGRPR